MTCSFDWRLQNFRELRTVIYLSLDSEVGTMATRPETFDLIPADLFDWFIQKYFGNSQSLLMLLVLQFVNKRFRAAVIKPGSETSLRVKRFIDTPANVVEDYLEKFVRAACRYCSKSLLLWTMTELARPIPIPTGLKI